MNFLNPLALFGLIAAAIPIIIHFLNLRKLKTIEFSSLRFLKELQKTKIRNLKIKQWILLLLRTLAILFIVLALARPTIEGTIPGFSSYSNTSSVIIIDNSFSLDLSDKSGNRFKQVRNAALSLLDNFRKGDEAAVLSMTDSELNQYQKLSRNFIQIKEHLSKQNISYFKANLSNSMRKALKLLENAKNLNKEIFIISDAQSNIFKHNFDDSISSANNIAVYFVKIGDSDGNNLKNVSIDSVSVKNRIFQYNKLVDTEVSIRNNSDSKIDNLAISMLFNKRKVSQRNINLNPKTTKIISLSAKPKDYGLIRAEINIEDDILNIDNKRFFGFLIPDKPKIAIFGNNEQTFYLNLVLGNKTKINSPAQTEFYPESKLQGVNFSNYEIIIVAGGKLNSSDYNKLKSYIKEGGNVIFFANESSNIEALKELGFGNVSLEEFNEKEPAQFTNIEKIHPLFEGIFEGTTDNKKIVESPSIYKALINKGGLALISMTGGNFLTESKLDSGKILYFAVPPQANWSNFPITGLFPTIIYKSILYLSTREGLGNFANLGEPFKLTIPIKFTNNGKVKVIDPTEQENFYPAAEMPSGAVLSFENIEMPGVYTINSNNNRIIDIINFNVPPEESILNFFDDNDIEKQLKPIVSENSSIDFIYDTRNIMSEVNRIRTGTELWQIAIILAILCLLAEMIISKNSKNEESESI